MIIRVIMSNSQWDIRFFHDQISLLLLQILLDLLPTNWMIEVLVLLKSLFRQLSINRHQLSIKCSYKLHSTYFTQQLGSRLVYGFILCSQANAKVAGAKFNVLGVNKGVSLAHSLTLSWGERSREELNLLKEDDDLVCGPTFNIRWRGGEILE